MSLDFRVRRGRKRKIYRQPARESGGIRTSAAQLLKIIYWSFRHHAKHNPAASRSPAYQAMSLAMWIGFVPKVGIERNVVIHCEFPARGTKQPKVRYSFPLEPVL